mgnify:CR=1 FL=1
MTHSFSRRIFGLGSFAGALTVALPAQAADDTAKAPSQDEKPTRRTICYIGGYTKHGPPGGNGTTIVTGRSGQAALAMPEARMAAAAAVNLMVVLMLILSSSGCFFYRVCHWSCRG